MKRIFAAAIAAIALCANAPAQNLGDLLRGLTGGKDSTATATQENAGSTDGGGILGALGSTLGNIIATDKFKAEDLVGTWNYKAPAVAFQSENILKKAGGAAAATTIENKLAPYYSKLGLTRTTITVDQDLNFTMKFGVVTLSGTVSKDENNHLVFAFSAFGKVSLGKMTASATKVGDTLNLTFDATKLIQLLTKVAGVIHNQTLDGITKLLSSYDGIYMGFKLTKQG